MKIKDLAPAVQTLDSAIHQVSNNQSISEIKNFINVSK